MFKGFKAVDVVYGMVAWEIARLDMCAGTVGCGLVQGLWID